MGHPTALPDDWLPASIGGEFTTSDFAGRELPFETDLGENAPSDVRLRLIHDRITAAANLVDSVKVLEREIVALFSAIRWRMPLWNFPEIVPAWVTFLAEIEGRRFAALPNLNSFCGFSDLFAVTDTPASGIENRKDSQASLIAFGSVMELAWHLAQLDEEIGALYSTEFQKAKAVPHQYALRRCGAMVLKVIWRELEFVSKPDHASNYPAAAGRPFRRRR